MGDHFGFPIPRWISNSRFAKNPRWKLHAFNAGIPAFLLAFLAYRHMYLGMVTLINHSSTHHYYNTHPIIYNILVVVSVEC
jgi:hypothetical protein